MEQSFSEPGTGSIILRITGRISAYAVVTLGAVLMIAPF